MKAFAEYKINVAKIMVSLSDRVDRVENIVGKGENAGHQNFLLFQLCLQKPFSRSLKVEIGGKEINNKITDSPKGKSFADNN